MATRAEASIFENYDSAQAASYARHRGDYSQALYDAVLLYHAKTGGHCNFLLDVGCGPGNVTRSLCDQFEHAVGIDASLSMAQHADELSRAAGARTRTGQPLRFYQSSAESLGAELDDPSRAIADASVDLLTVANAAHWFDMPAFWQAAERVLRPRGTVAIWIPGEGVVHPSTPGAAALDALLARLVERELLPHATASHHLYRDRYRSLPLPWTGTPPAAPGFARHEFQRREWDLGHDKHFLNGGDRPVPLERFMGRLGTVSLVARWREANPEMAGTEKDVLNVMRAEMEAVLRSHGVKEGEEMVRMAIDGTLLLFKKR